MAKLARGDENFTNRIHPCNIEMFWGVVVGKWGFWGILLCFLTKSLVLI
jgi:hypothetical protein